MSSAVFSFHEAVRESCKASILIEGLSGTGKSGLALELARGLCDKWEEIFAIDTENKSLNLFEGLKTTNNETFEKFKVGQLTADIGYKPSNYLMFRDVAIKQGAKVVIEDSISHAWQYKGGVLDIVTKVQANQKNQYTAWGDSEVVSEKIKILDLIRSDKVHVIATVRVKEKHEIIDGKPVSIGEQQIQQGDLKYEADLVLHMDKPGNTKGGVLQHPVATVIKTRYAIFNQGETYEFTPELIQQLRDYLEQGADPEVLLKTQQEEYVKEITAYLDSHKSAVAIWNVLKEDAGFKDVPIKDIPLSILKVLYIKLTTD